MQIDIKNQNTAMSFVIETAKCQHTFEIMYHVELATVCAGSIKSHCSMFINKVSRQQIFSTLTFMKVWFAGLVRE